MENKKNNHQIYLVGGVVGALLGIVIAHFFIKSSPSEEKTIQISPQKGMRIGLQTVNFMYQLLNLIRKA